SDCESPSFPGRWKPECFLCWTRAERAANSERRAASSEQRAASGVKTQQMSE
ncbi:uncharacterized protein V6R79_016077, partial [Siganus canaliculatus]